MQHPNLNPPIKSVCTTTNAATDSNPVFIIETYYDSTTGNWYRKYSDETIEQGGFAPKGSSNDTSTNVTFVVPLTDNNIQIYLAAKFNAQTTTSYNGGMMPYAITQDSSTGKYTQFSIWWDVRVNEMDGCFWRAIGR